MNIKQTAIDDKWYNVIPYKDYCKYPDLNKTTATAVEMEIDGETKILPVRTPSETAPGIYDQGIFDRIVDPDPSDGQYKPDNVLDLSNISNIEDLIQMQDKVRDIEKEILTSPDDITVPNISSLDSPEMKAVKEAIIAKHMDINKYSERFGSNFANDKRILKTNSITQKMMKRILSISMSKLH